MNLYSALIIILHLNIINCVSYFNKTIFNDEACETKTCIFKCCPIGYIFYKKTCVAGHEELDFSDVNVYAKDMSKTDRSLKDAFHLVAGKFEADPEFSASVYDISKMFNMYLREDGVLLSEMPNIYNRWNTYPQTNYCVEYRQSKNGSIGLHYWTIMGDDDPTPLSSSYMTYATLLSCVFMLLVLIVYALLPELRNLCGMILMAYVFSLFWAFLLLAVIQLDSHYPEVCIGLTLLIYFFFLATFAWMNVMSYDIWWTFRGYAKARPIHRRGERFKFCMYCLYAWGVPLAMTITLGVLNTVDMKHLPWFITPQVPRRGCFIQGGIKFFYLYVPMLIMIICNWLFYLMTAYNVWRLSRGTAVLSNTAAGGTPSAHRTQRHRFMLYLKLSIVMGLNWLLEVVSFVWPGFKLWYITDAYNVLIGLAIFLIFVCKVKIFKKIKKRLNLNKTQWYPSSKSYASSTSDTNQESVSMQVCSNPKGYPTTFNDEKKPKDF